MDSQHHNAVIVGGSLAGIVIVLELLRAGQRVGWRPRPPWPGYASWDSVAR